MIKLLLCCTKAKPYLYLTEDAFKERNIIPRSITYWNGEIGDDYLNGKIVAECDYDVEKIRKGWGSLLGTRYFRSSKKHYYPDYELEQQSCLCFDKIDEYLKGVLNEKSGYAINIKNLYIFDAPKDLGDYATITKDNYFKEVVTAPRTMCKVVNYETRDTFIFISVSSEEMCRIINRKQTTLVRKKVLKEMLKDE